MKTEPKRCLIMSFLLLLSVTALSGCNSSKFDELTTGGIPDDYRTRHPIIVKEREQSTNIAVASTDRSLSYAQRDIARGFFSLYRTRASGIIYIFVPDGSANAKAANHLRTQLRAEFEARGVPANKIIYASYKTAPHDAAPIRLTFVGLDAMTSECGRWPKDIYNDDKNQNYYNFGCAVQNNLAAQIADPNDFVAPRGMTSIDAVQRGNAIQDYRSTFSDVVGGQSN